MCNNYYRFCVPQCYYPPFVATGPTGIGVLGYGGAYNAAGAVVTTAATPVQVPLDTAMPGLGVVAAANTLTLASAGTYLVNYSVNGTVVVADTITAGVRLNSGVFIGDLSSAETAAAGGEIAISGSSIVTLPAGSVLDLAISDTNAPNALIIPAGSGTMFSVVRLA